MSKDYAEILREIEADVEKYSPHPDKVKIVAVSKYVEPDVALEAYKQDIKCFGENRAQLLLPKKDYFDENESWGTPTTLGVSNKKVVSSLSGYTDDTSELDNFFTELGMK